MGIVLEGQVALVTGASRGLGKGIALQLGEAGATVYITGRRPEISDNIKYGLPSLEQVAESITRRGGKGIALYVDHSNMEEVKFLFEKIKNDQDGQLDILVNNVYNSLNKISDTIGKKFYELDPSFWDSINDVGLRNHYYCSVYAARMMVDKSSGLIVNIGSIGSLKYVRNVAYGVGKEALNRMSFDMAAELKDNQICVITLIPGSVKTEYIEKGIIDENGLTNSHSLIPNVFELGETGEFTGKAVVRFSVDPSRIKRSGRILLTEDMAQKYGFTDESGHEPSHIRSVKTILETLGKPEIAKYIPANVKIPKWMMWQSINRF